MTGWNLSASTPQDRDHNTALSPPLHNLSCVTNLASNNCVWGGTIEEPRLDTDFLSDAEVTSLAAMLMTVFLCSAVANVLVVVVFSHRPASLSLSDRFVANLTLCNCLFTFLIMPLALASLLSRRWMFGPGLCQGTGLLVNLLVTASILTLVVISLDRHCAVVTPLHYSMRMTRKRCAAFIAGIWVTSFVVSFPPLVGWNRIAFDVDKMICTVAWSSEALPDHYYTLALVTVTFLLPLTIMFWTYTCIFRAARDNSERTRRSSTVPTVQAECEPCQCTPLSKRRRSSSVPILRRLSQSSCRSGSLLPRREEWKTAITSFLILFSFMICWTPYFLVILLTSLTPSLPLRPIYSTLSTAAAMFACACNPLVYVFRSKASRNDLMIILTRRRSFREELVKALHRGDNLQEQLKQDREKGSVLWAEDIVFQGKPRSDFEERSQLRQVHEQFKSNFEEQNRLCQVQKECHSNFEERNRLCQSPKQCISNSVESEKCCQGREQCRSNCEANEKGGKVKIYQKQCSPNAICHVSDRLCQIQIYQEQNLSNRDVDNICHVQIVHGQSRPSSSFEERGSLDQGELFQGQSCSNFEERGIICTDETIQGQSHYTFEERGELCRDSESECASEDCTSPSALIKVR